MRKNIVIIILLLVFFIMLDMYFIEKGKRIEQDNLIEASNSELQIWKNKEGESLAKIQVLETGKKKTFLDFKAKDSTIRELQALVDKNKGLFNNSVGTAGIIKSETIIDTVTVTVVSKDTITGHSIYKSSIKDKWFSVNTIATKDSTTISLKTFHDLQLVMGSEGQGFLKKRKTYATAQDLNPHSNIKDMRIYNVRGTVKRYVIGPYGGYGITKAGDVGRIGWQIGFGVTYKLLEF